MAGVRGHDRRGADVRGLDGAESEALDSRKLYEHVVSRVQLRHPLRVEVPHHTDVLQAPAPVGICGHHGQLGRLPHGAHAAHRLGDALEPQRRLALHEYAQRSVTEVAPARREDGLVDAPAHHLARRVGPQLREQVADPAGDRHERDGQEERRLGAEALVEVPLLVEAALDALDEDRAPGGGDVPKVVGGAPPGGHRDFVRLASIENVGKRGLHAGVGKEPIDLEVVAGVERPAVRVHGPLPACAAELAAQDRDPHARAAAVTGATDSRKRSSSSMRPSQR